MSALSRRKFFDYSLGAAATASIAPVSLTPSAHAAPLSSDAGLSPQAFVASIGNAVAFMSQMMDAYASGSTVRLIQSYADQSRLS